MWMCWFFLLLHQGRFCSVCYFVLTLHMDCSCASSRYYSSLDVSPAFIVDSTNLTRIKKRKIIVEECNICQSIIIFFLKKRQKENKNGVLYYSEICAQ